MWGEWGRYDEHNIETYPQYYFRIDLYESDSDDDRYSVRKTLVNNEHVKKYATFNREVIWDGVWSVIGWLFYFLIWWVIFKYHSKNLEKEDLNRARWVVVRERFFTLLKIVAVCGIFTLVVGQGGEMCSSTDMFGCSEYSGEYRESWSGDQKWETFVKILGVTLFAWIMALKGYKIEGGRGSYWR